MGKADPRKGENIHTLTLAGSSLWLCMACPWLEGLGTQSPEEDGDEERETLVVPSETTGDSYRAQVGPQN